MEHTTSPASTTNNSRKTFIKVIAIGLIGLILMIPVFMVDRLVTERHMRSKNVKDEITMKWGEEESITTPVIVVPYYGDTEGTDYLYLLPREVKTTGNLEIEMRHRSIFEIPVYTSDIHISGIWHKEDIARCISENHNGYELNNAKIVMAVNDPRGFRDILHINVNGKEIKLKTDGDIDLPTCYEIPTAVINSRGPINNVQSADYPINLDDNDSIIAFDCDLSLRGSNRFGILSTGMSSSTTIKGNWGEPSFQGNSLPTQTNISENQFEAEWETVFTDSHIEEDNLDFMNINATSVNFVDSVDQYTRVDRSIKYSVLIIALTLLSIFLVDLTLQRRGKAINILHYLLTGLSLVLFYSLLLSFSEFIGFGMAYLIAAVMTTGLNTLYFRSVIRENRTALMLGGVLAFLYTSVFVLLSLENYALLIGSLFLFVILAFMMFLSAKIIRTE